MMDEALIDAILKSPPLLPAWIPYDKKSLQESRLQQGDRFDIKGPWYPISKTKGDDHESWLFVNARNWYRMIVDNIDLDKAKSSVLMNGPIGQYEYATTNDKKSGTVLHIPCDIY